MYASGHMHGWIRLDGWKGHVADGLRSTSALSPDRCGLGSEHWIGHLMCCGVHFSQATTHEIKLAMCGDQHTSTVHDTPSSKASCRR